MRILGFLLAVVAFAAPAAAATDPRASLPAPAIELTAAQQQAWAPRPARPATVPVLNYHAVTAEPGPYNVTRQQLAEHMAMLARGGYRTITIRQYQRFLAGDLAGLPSRPILITFDDGYLSSFRGADQVLAQHGFSAVMFVITSIADTAQVQADAGALTSSYLAWGELAAMARGGRWELQFHANQGHRLIPVAAGQTGPFYANLLYADGQRELFYLFKRRVSGDILAGRATMYAKAPGFVPVAFVVPYGEYGQKSTNYAPIPEWARSWMLTAFKVLFIQDHAYVTRPGETVAYRYAIHDTTTAQALRDWLTRSPLAP